MTWPTTERPSLRLFPLGDIPLVRPGDDLASLIVSAVKRNHLALAPRDIVVVAQKIVSKAESRYVDLATVHPSPRACELAEETLKDPRLVEVILSESRRVVRARPGLLICEHRLGFVMANAGVDRSNLDPREGAERVLLLPRDPDTSAAHLRARLLAESGVDLAVVINDSFGRPWRVGTVGVAIGAAGLPSLLDLRGRPDLSGRPLEVTVVGLADEIASAASLLMGQADESRPVVLIHGLAWTAPAQPAAAIVRPAAEDLFR
jgi:coenzyme F420-0:L-glutamate ligase/coenzyme F420-1:gamma-L-glutamate ligase